MEKVIIYNFSTWVQLPSIPSWAIMTKETLEEVVKDTASVKAQPLNSALEVAFHFPVT